MCLGVLIPFMALRRYAAHILRRPLTLPADHIVQGHWFDLIEDLGCSPPSMSIYISALLILWIPLLFISFVSAIYAGKLPVRDIPYF